MAKNQSESQNTQHKKTPWDEVPGKSYVSIKPEGKRKDLKKEVWGIAAMRKKLSRDEQEKLASEILLTEWERKDITQPSEEERIQLKRTLLNFFETQTEAILKKEVLIAGNQIAHCIARFDQIYTLGDGDRNTLRAGLENLSLSNLKELVEQWGNLGVLAKRFHILSTEYPLIPRTEFQEFKNNFFQSAYQNLSPEERQHLLDLFRGRKSFTLESFDIISRHLEENGKRAFIGRFLGDVPLVVLKHAGILEENQITPILHAICRDSEVDPSSLSTEELDELVVPSKELSNILENPQYLRTLLEKSEYIQDTISSTL